MPRLPAHPRFSAPWAQPPGPVAANPALSRKLGVEPHPWQPGTEPGAGDCKDQHFLALACSVRASVSVCWGNRGTRCTGAPGDHSSPEDWTAQVRPFHPIHLEPRFLQPSCDGNRLSRSLLVGRLQVSIVACSSCLSQVPVSQRSPRSSTSP